MSIRLSLVLLISDRCGSQPVLSFVSLRVFHLKLYKANTNCRKTFRNKWERSKGVLYERCLMFTHCTVETCETLTEPWIVVTDSSTSLSQLHSQTRQEDLVPSGTPEVYKQVTIANIAKTANIFLRILWFLISSPSFISEKSLREKSSARIAIFRTDGSLASNPVISIKAHTHTCSSVTQAFIWTFHPRMEIIGCSYLTTKWTTNLRSK